MGPRFESVKAHHGPFRRCGWLDAVILRFAVRVNGLTGIAMNKLDTLSGLDTVKICVAYNKNGVLIRDFPSDISELAECEPVYIELPGWQGDISGARSFDELPETARQYLRTVEKEIGCKIAMVGVGPDRDQNFDL